MNNKLNNRERTHLASGSLATIRKILIVQMEMVLMNTDEKYCTRKDILMYFPVCENTYRKLEKLGRAPNVVGFDGRINLYDVSEVCKFLANPENYSTEVTPPRRKDGWRKTAKCRGCGKTFMPKKARKGKTEYCSSICYYDHKTTLSKIRNECEFYDELAK